MAQPGDRLGDRYELLEPIGSGGMATVWRARDIRLRRTVAVKILRPQFAEDPEFVARFESEARHAASLAHPNVAAVYDTGFDPGPDGGTRYIVMELVDGPTVADLLANGPLPALQAVEIAVAAARALAAAHRRGIVHRDVKPGNLLIGPDGRARLADFGIARALATSRLTTAGAMLGSAPYMSPEQAGGEDALATSDIYSLGVVLHEMLLGRRPDRPTVTGDVGRGGSDVDARDKPDSGVGSRITQLPGGLAKQLARALEPDPADRYPSARVFANALESAARSLRRTPTAARGPGRRTAAAPVSVNRAPTRKGRPRFEPVVAPVNAPGPVAHAPGVAASAASAVSGGALTPTALGHPARSVPRPGGRFARPIARPGGDRRDRRGLLLVLAGPIAIAGAFLVSMAMVSLAARSLGGVLAATATPPPALTAASPSHSLPIVAASPSAAPSASGSPPPASSPPPTATAGATPTPRAAATPRPTPRPVPAGTTERPTTAVADFYDAVEAHDWDRAIARWSPSMQRRYPPDEWLIGRFSRTTRIDITRLRQLAIDSAAGTASVAVSLVEYRSDDPTPRTFSGSWDLARRNGRWLLDQPHF